MWGSDYNFTDYNFRFQGASFEMIVGEPLRGRRRTKQTNKHNNEQ